ncbi:EscT/YscT/HrcT family type III secretion system export apparatus protein [Paracoccus sp. (in: a-proteobacteria)]|uniref:EscT/YscT/HrcT family type III secretion system export apparatus protein n=1 Tax=Paracoccus sp. TaxID=267 RepID=UPI003A864DE7
MNEAIAELFAGRDLAQGVSAMIALMVAVAGRPLGFVLVQPVFGRFGLTTGLLRGSVLVALTAPVLPSAAAMAAASPEIISFGSLPFLLLRELIIGVVLGLLTGVPLWAAMAAGEFIDIQRGASMATLLDPQSSTEMSVTGTMLFLTCLLVLAVEGVLFPVFFGPFFESYRLFPVLGGVPQPVPSQGELALRLLDQIFRAGLILALPLIIPLLLAEFMLAVATKYVQQINTMFLAMSVKQIIYSLLMLFYAVMLARYAVGQIGRGSFGVDALIPFLRPEMP